MECVFLLLLHVLLLAHAINEPPPYQTDPMLLGNGVKAMTIYPGGIDYLGIGYNLLYGNPDGSPTTAVLDPGLRPTWRVFDWTFNKGRSTPDQVAFTQSSSCAKSQNLDLFHNAYAYASKFEKQVGYKSGVRFRFASTKHSQSDYYKVISASLQTNAYIYYEELNLCHLGQARLTSELAGIDDYPLSKTFVHRANALPARYIQNSSDPDYMQFIHDFGTHLVYQINLGTKIMKRYQWTSTDFAYYSAEHYSSSTFDGGSFLAFKKSISVNTDSLKGVMDTGFSAGLEIGTFTLGDDKLAMLYSYTLMGMEEVFEAEYWQLNDNYVSAGILSNDFYGRLSTMQSNMELALADYPFWLNCDETKKDPIVTVPITWPKGAFGLPKTNTGCPKTPGFTFHSGWRFQDCEDNNNGNRWSSPLHFVSGSYGRDIYQHFCVKTQDTVTKYDVDWPKGEYCVFKQSNNNCPK
ncbi:uncharacterized protein LOC117118225, partial [Anneissia japonica]|uniref:uncharacterized protein LOC117118225 n=1 Tax=Anneissia japonica TaxID=1529436 RepID=UPI0014256D89